MATRKSPPKAKTPTTPDDNKIVETKWTPFQIDGIDVRLFRASYFNAAGDELERAAVPEIDPSYVFRAEMVREFAWAVWPHDQGDWTPCLLTGPKGSGKTSLVIQIAARCNVPVFRTNLNVGTTVRHLKGRVGAQNGKTIYVPGIATMAMEAGGWLLLDEVSGATPPVALSLFPILEPTGAVLLEDAQPPRYVRRHKDFRIFATDNTIGAAMEEARFEYSGTNPDVNSALLDRFGSLIEVGYMAEKDEHCAVASKVKGIDSGDLEGMVRVANGIRESSEVGSGFSTRMVIDWARRVAAGLQHANGDIVHADEMADDLHILNAASAAFLNKQKSSVERDAISEVIRRVFAIEED